jgi:hypothetical protein
VVREATDDNVSIGGKCEWQPGTEMVGCSRAIIVIPLKPDTFDDLINGRSGYRAQYYLSVEEGQRFNRKLVSALCVPAKRIFDRDPKIPGWDVVEGSIRGRLFDMPCSKLRREHDWSLCHRRLRKSRCR